MIARLRQARRDDTEGGFALIFVLLVTTMVMLGVATALAAVSPNVISSKRSQDAMSALAAARSGVDDLIAYLVSIPACRSETKICPNALNGSSTNTPGRSRPTLGTGQTFSWKTNPAVTTEGYVRVTSTGTSNGVSRTLVADLSLQPSILSYGYYSDYESFAPSFLTGYYNKRNVYVSNSSVYDGYLSNSYGGSAPELATWADPTNTNNCGQHWYYESASSPGRKQNGSTWSQRGTVNGRSRTDSDGCDLVFSSAMVQDGKTFSRDALLSSGAGPKFNQPVYTMWGYNDDDQKQFNNPLPTAGKYYRGDTMTNTTNLPAVAGDDLVLPKSIGMDGLADDACVYTGPTRVKLNGDGTATVTSPGTTVKNPASDPNCYPAGAITGSGVLGFVVNYATAGSGTIIVRQRGTAPTAGWPANPTRSTQTPAAGNEVFYVPATGAVDVTRHADISTSGVDCANTTGKKYSAAAAAACAWTNVATATDFGGDQGWSSYTAVKCGNPPTTSNRQRFECEYGSQAGSSTPAVTPTGGQYATVRNNIRAELGKGNCLTGSLSAQATCISSMVNTQLAPANDSDQRYTATSTVGTSVDVSTTTGSSTMDPFFTAPNPATEKLVNTPITTTVQRQALSNGRASGSPTDAFSFTTTQSDYTYTPAGSTAYFPNPLDVTDYNTGTSSTGATAGSTGVNQPADLYVDGNNKGKLSLVADNDVIITGNISNPTGYTPATDALSIAAGKNVRNYHPVKCVDQVATDINNTSPGWCPNDITGLTSDSMISNGGYETGHPARQYANMLSAADRNVDAAVFALSGSLRTDNYNRGAYVGYFNINGGVYQAFRGGNGVISGTNQLSGTTLQYKYVDLQRAELPYVPPASSGNYSRPWDVVSISAGPS